jgi:hypothetical protein
MSILVALQGPVEVNLSAAILEGSDSASATVDLAISLNAAILEGSDIVAATVDVTDAVNLSAAILEGSDTFDGTVNLVSQTETFSGGWERHPYLRGPRRVRFKFKDEEIPQPVGEIVQSLAETIPPDTLSRDLEIALRLRLRNQEIAYRFVYLILLEQEVERIRTRQDKEAVELLLLH